MIEMTAPTEVPGNSSLVTAITNVQFWSASAEAQEPGQQGRAALGRALGHPPLHASIRHELLLVSQVVLPGDVTRMVVLNQYLPLISRHIVAGALASPTVNHHRLGTGASVHKCTRVHRVLQYGPDAGVAGKLPDNLRAVTLRCSPSREGDPLLPIPQQDLTDASHFGKLGEHSADGVLDLPVRNQFQTILLGSDVSDRGLAQDLASLDLQSQGLFV